MFSMLAILIYAAATGIPAWLLYRFGSAQRYWHVLSIVAALGLGFIPLPSASSHAYDMTLGFAFVFLLVWGIGGLFAFRPHHARHA
jgi:hypothetical protein